jgi:hypothetical protein
VPSAAILSFQIDWPTRLTVSGKRVGLLQPVPTRSTGQRLETTPGMASPSLEREVSGNRRPVRFKYKIRNPWGDIAGDVSVLHRRRERASVVSNER